MIDEHTFEDDDMFCEFMSWFEKGIIPLKFTYAGSAAQSHDEFARTLGYKKVQADTQYEVDLLTEELGSKLAHIASIVDIGSGNGQHSAYLIKAILSSLNMKKIPEYSCIDFSRELLRIARQEIERVNPGQSVTELKIDIEKDNARIPRSSDAPALFLLLGNTIANLEEPRKISELIASSIKPGDFFLASFLVRPKAAMIDATLASYSGEEFRKAVLMPFQMAGVPEKSINLDVIYDKDEEGVIGFASFQEDWAISWNERVVNHTSGTKIRCFVSRRFQTSDVLSMFRSRGLNAKVINNKNKGLAHLLAWK